MALLIPKLGAARFDTRGESRLAERFVEKLEDNAIVWRNVPVGARGRYPDFLLLHPDRGMLVLEVKDWRIDNIVRATRTHVEYLTERGVVALENPIEQARQYLFEVKQMLERETLLVGPSDTAFAGRLAVPFGWGAVLPNITRKQFDATDLSDVIDPSRVVCRDEMAESVDADAFRDRVWHMVSRRFGPALTLPQIDLIRALVFPEIVVRDDRQATLFDDMPHDPDARILRVMDLQQEQLARNIGEGHRIIRGVAGSGKTMLLVFRAEQLALIATRPILVLCYNRVLAARLESQMQSRGIETKVVAQSFHAWCHRMLRQYDQPLPDDQDSADRGAFSAELVRRVITAVDRGHIPTGQYDAVLIDEAHDFEDEWLQLAARMVSPSTRALMILYDNAQSIYRDRTQPVWSRLGIEAKGRTTVMKLNYRNTAEILSFAQHFAADVLAEPFDDDEAGLSTVLPESCGRRGVEPQLEKRVSESDEAHAAAQWCVERHRLSYAWSDMAVLAPNSFLLEQAERALKAAGVPYQLLESKRRGKADFTLDCICLTTLHSAKGLEFPAVAIIGLGTLPRGNDELGEAIRLVYVGMTRATHVLRMSYSRKSALVERLLAV